MMDRMFLGNTLGQYLVSLALFAAAMALFTVCRRLLLARLRLLAHATATDLDDIAVEILERIHAAEWMLYAGYLATHSLDLPGRIEGVFHTAVVLALGYRTIKILQGLTSYFIKNAVLARHDDAAHRDTARNITYAANAAIWVTVALFVLGNLGFNVTSMLAGLGIGGVAVALAAQAILGDLFSAIAIYLDKPFVVGDVIVVGDMTGTVEHIGVKTTRVRSISGEMLVIANSILTSSKIKNFQHLRERRIVCRFGIVHHTPADVLKTIPDRVRVIVGRDPKARLDRVHFAAIADSSFDFEFVYHVLDADYNVYMDVNERIHLALVEAFQKEGVSFAYPTRTVITRPA